MTCGVMKLKSNFSLVLENDFFQIRNFPANLTKIAEAAIGGAYKKSCI